jgi:membrane protein
MPRWVRTQIGYLIRTVERWQADGGSTQSAAMAYYATFSFFPLVLILIAVLGFVLSFSAGARDAQDELLVMLGRNTSDLLAAQVKTAMTEIRARAVIGGPLGIVTLLLGSIGMFTQLDAALDQIWGNQRESRGVFGTIANVLVYRLRAFLMLLGLGLLIVVVFVAGLVTSAARPFASDLPLGQPAWHAVQVGISLLINWLLFSVIYKVLPRVTVPWGAAARGGALAAALWQATREVLALLVFGQSYSAYGVVGSLIALMFWIYIACNVVLLGAQYVRVAADHRRTA